jgi:Ca2+-transporting ATPase
MINCRKLDNSFNVFAGMHRNLWLLGILAISTWILSSLFTIQELIDILAYSVIGGQIMIVFIGGAAFGTTAISIAYWGISIALGAGGLIVGLLTRLIPDEPIGQLLIKLGVMPNIDALPRTRNRRETGETGDEKVYRCKYRHEWLALRMIQLIHHFSLRRSPKYNPQRSYLSKQKFP